MWEALAIVYNVWSFTILKQQMYLLFYHCLLLHIKWWILISNVKYTLFLAILQRCEILASVV